jgi:hypothetical protein
MSVPTFAELPCVAAIYYDPAETDPDDLVVRNVQWSQVIDIDADIDGLEIIMFKLKYTTQGFTGTTIISGRDEYALKYFPNVGGREAMRIAQYQKSPGFGQRFRLSDGDATTIAVSTFFPEAPSGFERSVLSGNDEGGILSVPDGSLFETLQDRAFALDVGICP